MNGVPLHKAFYIVRIETNEICYGPYELEQSAIDTVKLNLADPQKYMIVKLVPIMMFERCLVTERRLS